MVDALYRQALFELRQDRVRIRLSAPWVAPYVVRGQKSQKPASCAPGLFGLELRLSLLQFLPVQSRHSTVSGPLGSSDENHVAQDLLDPGRRLCGSSCDRIVDRNQSSESLAGLQVLVRVDGSILLGRTPELEVPLLMESRSKPRRDRPGRLSTQGNEPLVDGFGWQRWRRPEYVEDPPASLFAPPRDRHR